MKLQALQETLLRHRDKQVRFILPGGRAIPAEFHVTEVGYVVVNSIDCGGTVRQRETCLLQLWVSATDKRHRLSAKKLGAILESAGKLIPSREMPVEVEYEARVFAQYSVDGVESDQGELRFELGPKHTDCLARDVCEARPAASACGCAGSKKSIKAGRR